MARKRAAPRIDERTKRLRNSKGCIPDRSLLPSKSPSPSQEPLSNRPSHHEISSRIHARAASCIATSEALPRNAPVAVNLKRSKVTIQHRLQDAQARGGSNQGAGLGSVPYMETNPASMSMPFISGSSVSPGYAAMNITGNGLSHIDPRTRALPHVSSHQNLDHPPSSLAYLNHPAQTVVRHDQNLVENVVGVANDYATYQNQRPSCAQFANPIRHPQAFVSVTNATSHTNEDFQRGENLRHETSKHSLEKNAQSCEKCSALDATLQEIHAMKLLIAANNSVMKEYTNAANQQAEAARSQTEALLKLNASITSINEFHSYPNSMAFERKPLLEKRRIADALRLGCTYSGCDSREDWKECPVTNLWSKALANWLPELKRKSGSPLGVHISETARKPSADVDAFYPMHDAVFRNVLEEVVNYVAKLLPGVVHGIGEDHIDAFFETNKGTIIGEIGDAFRNSRNSKKIELVRNYKLFSSSDSYAKQFETGESIDRGDYRCTESTPIDKEGFCDAVRKTVGLCAKDQRNPSNGTTQISVGIHQLSFACVCLIKSFANHGAGVSPILFRIMPSGGTTRVRQAFARWFS